MMIDKLIANLRKHGQPRVTFENGRTFMRDFVGGNRYAFDTQICPPTQGWVQYDTDQDASYFGKWIHKGRRMMVTFAEGDITIVKCTDDDAYNEQLQRMDEFHGKIPSAVAIDTDTGARTEYYQDRDALLIR